MTQLVCLCKHFVGASEISGAFSNLALTNSVIVCSNVLDTPVTSDSAFQNTTNWPKQKLNDVGDLASRNPVRALFLFTWLPKCINLDRVPPKIGRGIPLLTYFLLQHRVSFSSSKGFSFSAHLAAFSCSKSTVQVPLHGRTFVKESSKNKQKKRPSPLLQHDASLVVSCFLQSWKPLLWGSGFPKGPYSLVEKNTFGTRFGWSDIPVHRCTGISECVKLTEKVFKNKLTERN
jgi:hypothetical protein